MVQFLCLKKHFLSSECVTPHSVVTLCQQCKGVFLAAFILKLLYLFPVILMQTQLTSVNYVPRVLILSSSEFRIKVIGCKHSPSLQSLPRLLSAGLVTARW